jgi:hypothetical protein
MVGDEDFGGIMGLASSDRKIDDKFGVAIWWNNFGEGSPSSFSSTTTTSHMTIIGSITTFLKNIFFCRGSQIGYNYRTFCTTQTILQRLSFKIFMLGIRVSRAPLALISSERIKL